MSDMLCEGNTLRTILLLLLMMQMLLLLLECSSCCCCYLGAIDRDLSAKERDMEVDSFLDEMNYSFQHPQSPRNYATGRTTTTNFGQGEALILVETRMGTQIAARTTHAHLGVAQGGGTLATAITKDSDTSAATGGSSMVLIDDEDVKEEKGNEGDGLVTSSGVMEMSSTEEENNPPPHPLPFSPPPPQPTS